MKHLMTAVCLAALMATTAAAQMPPMDKGKMPMGKTDTSKMAPATPHSALHVTSVKMIAATCP